MHWLNLFAKFSVTERTAGERYTEPGLVTFYNIWPGNRAGLFLQPRSLHGACTICNIRQCSLTLSTDHQLLSGKKRSPILTTSVGNRRLSRSLAISPQVTEAINPVVYAVTSPATEHHRSLAGTKLYCHLVTGYKADPWFQHVVTADFLCETASDKRKRFYGEVIVHICSTCLIHLSTRKTTTRKKCLTLSKLLFNLAGK